MIPWDPLHGDGYQLWSGIGGDAFLVTGGLVWWRKHNCHVRGCWRLQWHPHPLHGHVVCKKHHPADRASLGRRVGCRVDYDRDEIGMTTSDDATNGW